MFLKRVCAESSLAESLQAAFLKAIDRVRILSISKMSCTAKNNTELCKMEYCMLLTSWMNSAINAKAALAPIFAAYGKMQVYKKTILHKQP